MHKSLEEMVKELVQKSNLSDKEINGLVEVDDVAKIDADAVLKRAEVLAAAKLPIGEVQRAEILVRSIHASKLIIHPPAVGESSDARVVRHHAKMSNGLNSVAHLDRGVVNGLDNEK